MTTTKAENANGRGRPTDMELMLYIDGELEEDRLKELEAFLERDETSRRKIRALKLASGMVREHTLSSSSKAGDIASLVMAKIEAGEGSSGATDSAAKSPIDLNKARLANAARQPAANDNSRSIFTLAALAVAAAAAMMIWGRMGAEPTQSADVSTPSVTKEAPAEPAPAEQPKPPAEPSEPQAAESEPEHGVEVAAVDFGAHMGTIFYVPTGATASSSTTTVVWVDDDVAGGK